MPIYNNSKNGVLHGGRPPFDHFANDCEQDRHVNNEQRHDPEVHDGRRDDLVTDRQRNIC